MVDGIGNTTGSIKDLPIYQQYYQLYLEYNKEHKTNISFDAWLQRTQYKQFFLQQVENYIETGSVNGGDGVNGNTLNAAKYVNNGNCSMYQSQDEETYYDFDFDNGTYTVYNSNEEVASVLVLDSDTPIDAISFGYKTAEISNYTFGNLEDGQDSTTRSLTQGKYGRVSYSEKEFDIDYIMNALLMNPNDPQYQKAVAIFDELVANMNQWCSAEDLAELDSVAAQYGTNSTEYKDKLKEIILKNLDQANEWVEGHEHVEFKNDDSMNIAPNQPDIHPDAVPDYDLNLILHNIGLTIDYNANKTWSGPKHYDNDTCEQSSVDDARKYVDEQLTKVINEMIAQMGDQCTPEIQGYLLKAKACIVASCASSSGESNHCGLNSVLGWVFAGATGTAWLLAEDSDGIEQTASDITGVLGCRTFGGGFFEDWGAKGQVNIKNMVDEFLRVFKELCENGGKSDAEIKAEKEAKEADYKTFYNMDLNALASSEGIKDTTVVPTGSNPYAEIQTKAENSVITPLKSQLKAKLEGKNIPDDEIEEILSQAATAALANPQDWATTDNNYTYTIDADKLIDIYEEFIKQGIKSKGYEF